jgi:hypothetical protein
MQIVGLVRREEDEDMSSAICKMSAFTRSFQVIFTLKISNMRYSLIYFSCLILCQRAAYFRLPPKRCSANGFIARTTTEDGLYFYKTLLWFL